MLLGFYAKMSEIHGKDIEDTNNLQIDIRFFDKKRKKSKKICNGRQVYSGSNQMKQYQLEEKNR